MVGWGCSSEGNYNYINLHMKDIYKVDIDANSGKIVRFVHLWKLLLWQPGRFPNAGNEELIVCYETGSIPGIDLFFVSHNSEIS